MKRIHRLQIPAWVESVAGAVVFFTVFFILIATKG